MSTTFITKNKKIIEKIEPFLATDEEILICEEVTKHHAHGGKDSRILLLTNLNFSLVRIKAFGNPIRSHDCSLLTLKKIKYQNPDQFSLNFGNELAFSSHDALQICETILYHYAVLYYANPAPIEIESHPSTALQLPKLTTRPHGLCMIRLRSFATKYKFKLNSTLERFFKEYDARLLPQMKLTSQHIPDNNLATAQIIAMEPNVNNIAFDNFYPKSIDTFTKRIIESMKNLVSITFSNYTESFTTIDTKITTAEGSKLAELCIQNCSYGFSSSLITALSKYSGRIQSVKFERCKFEKDHVRSLFSSLHKYPSFMKIKYFALNDGTVDHIDLNDFHSLFSRLRYLKYLIINKSNIDISQILVHIFKHASILENICIQNCRFLEPLDESVPVPPCIQMIDIGENQISPEGIGSLFRVLFTNPRRNTVTIYASKIASTSNMSELIDAMCIKNALPILAEFRFNRNEITPNSLKKLLDFLRTQSTLKYLALTNSITDDIEECFEHLSKFVNDGHVIGIEMLSTPPNTEYSAELIKFLKSIVGAKNLQILAVDRSSIGSEGLAVLKELIQANETFYSISCDGIGASSLQDLTDFYQFVADCSHLTNVLIPKIDFQQFEQNPLQLIPGLRFKTPPMSAQMRLKLYQKISTRLLNQDGPRPLIEVLQDSGVNSRSQLTNPLEEMMLYIHKMMVVNGHKIPNFGEKNAFDLDTNNALVTRAGLLTTSSVTTTATKQNFSDDEVENQSESDEELEDEDKKNDDDKIQIPNSEDLTELFLENLQTSLIPCISNRYRNHQSKLNDDVMLDTVRNLVVPKLETVNPSRLATASPSKFELSKIGGQ
ncbi:hypothetical protein TVAG_487540 [Trichomonas vaginalis G3]|uniref:Leucine Rich Repeat family protein n=1 Tax=Trichomonas vaginalis (strain ATCC PRA-98 / G3) TaxID=412133 RepID=A2EFN3_TRIV3|nr:ribonuclease inhibitor domain-containing protein [Trichomonas vaginalis G3]EAY08528.1 hypothetical protein TVAG_487540 [Trichomonas vaginalis G3]KAI5542089.1 ribonuclease inhibitor domain-containing protein [Trichomonas vaginalis G3]|eukprot:XP_001320751.1 hypothetical protein [Trichomonas vaginalis G3]